MSALLLVDPELLAVLARPEWSRPMDVEDELSHCFAVRSREQAEGACNGLLYALGNNHAGTYYPVVLAMFPGVRQLLESGTGWARYAIVEALIDLCGSFEPEAGYEQVDLPGEAPQPLVDALRTRVVALRAQIEHAAMRDDEASGSCRELLALLDP